MKKMLIDGCAELGIKINEKQAEQFQKYSKLLIEWNNKINLTSITDKEGIVTKHFLDSISVLKTGCVKGNVIDVGTGAGFPGIPIKIVCSDLPVMLLDSLNKRINFLKEAVSEIGLSGVSFDHSRAEDGARRMREKYDTCVSRAVANMTVLAEWCLPFVKPGGYFLALKGPLADEELKNADRAIKILGGEVIDVFETNIPFTDLSHKIIIVKKVRHTPMQYPRKAGIATKNPIESCYNMKQIKKNK